MEMQSVAGKGLGAVAVPSTTQVALERRGHARRADVRLGHSIEAAVDAGLSFRYRSTSARTSADATRRPPHQGDFGLRLCG